MKKIALLISSVLFMASCQQNGKGTAVEVNNDTIGLAAFKEAQINQKADSIANAIIDQKMMEAKAIEQPVAMPAAPAVVTRTVYVKSPARHSSRSTNDNNNYNNNDYNNAPAPTQPVAQSQPAAQRKGMSKSAKGAIVGGVAGTALGIIANRQNRAVGGVIGAAAGTAIGYGVGRSMDKKDGRVKSK